MRRPVAIIVRRCALERCYLEEKEHEDVRLVMLCELIDKLRALVLAMLDKSQQNKNAAPEEEATLQLLVQVDELISITLLCAPSEQAKYTYRNAFTFYYLKKRVLTISNKNDYKYLEKLFVNDATIGEYGCLYLQAVAGKGKATKIRDGCIDKNLYMPEDSDVGLVGLHTLVCENYQMVKGSTFVRANGQLVITIEHYNMEAHELRLKISDAGVCFAPAHMMTLELHWKGHREKPKSLQVECLDERPWTKQDRILHTTRIDNLNRFKHLSSAGF